MRQNINSVMLQLCITWLKTSRLLEYRFFSRTLILLALVFPAVAAAQVVSLDSIVKIIAQRNPMLQEYESRINSLNASAEGARGWMAPMVGLGTFMTPYPNQMLMEERDKGAWMLSVEQEIPNPAKLNANKNFLSSKALAEQQTQSVQLNMLKAEAKDAYYRWLISLEKLNILRENQKLMALMLKLAQIRYSYNQGNLGNIYKAEGRLSEIQNMVEMVNGEIEESAFRLKSLMNLPLESSLMIDTTTIISFDVSQLTADTAELDKQRSDIRGIERTIETMRLNQQLQRVQAKPDFKLRFDHMQPIGDMPTQFTAMAMVSIPIAPWSSRMYRSEVKAMEYDIEGMRKNREAILVETKGMLAAMASQLKRMKQQLENYETRLLPVLEKNYRVMMIAYEENREQLPMVMDAWETMNMAQMDFLIKKQEYYTMIVKYEKELER